MKLKFNNLQCVLKNEVQEQYVANRVRIGFSSCPEHGLSQCGGSSIHFWKQKMSVVLYVWNYMYISVMRIWPRAITMLDLEKGTWKSCNSWCVNSPLIISKKLVIILRTDRVARVSFDNINLFLYEGTINNKHSFLNWGTYSTTIMKLTLILNECSIQRSKHLLCTKSCNQ